MYDNLTTLLYAKQKRAVSLNVSLIVSLIVKIT